VTGQDLPERSYEKTHILGGEREPPLWKIPEAAVGQVVTAVAPSLMTRSGRGAG
jgi:hypothetical protein